MYREAKPTDNKIIVKIFDSDKELKNVSAGGIITTHTLNPILDYCQIGMAVAGGKNIMSFIKEGEAILFNWTAEDNPETFLGRDETGEYRYITEKQIYGTIKTKKSGESHIQPKKHYIVAEPEDKDYERTKSMYQIPVAAVNPEDEVAQAMGVKAGDWVICIPYSAVPITIKRKIFFFIYLEDILFINSGEHKISIQRKKVYKDLRLASRKETVQLN